MMATAPELRGNSIFSDISSEVWQMIRAEMTLVTLKQGTLLALGQVYFPVSTIVSMLARTCTRETIEVAVLGSDDTTGIWVAGSLEQSPVFPEFSFQVLFGGQAYKMSMHTYRAALKHPSINMRSINCMLRLLSQSGETAANMQHMKYTQQLAHWLVVRSNMACIRELPVTQQMIADLTGTRRETVTDAIKDLEKEGAISHRRGAIEIVSKMRLVEIMEKPL